MDTIKLTIDGHEVVISSKSMTVDDKEYLYTGISAIKHSSAGRLYLFNYEGEWQKFHYNEEDAKKVATLFKKIADLIAKRTARPASAEKNAAAPEEDTDTSVAAAVDVATPVEQPHIDAEKSDGAASMEDSETQAAELSDTLPISSDLQPEEPTTDQESKQETSDGDSVTAGSELICEEAEKKSKLKKALIIFAVIIVLFVGAGVAYFFTIGPANDASQGPVNETHQYNDIDELIDEMQE